MKSRKRTAILLITMMILCTAPLPVLADGGQAATAHNVSDLVTALANPSVDTIYLTANTYQLSGPLTVDHSVTFATSGAAISGIILLSAGGARHINATGNTTITFCNVALDGGGSGGGILYTGSAGTLTVDGATIQNCTGFTRGGGISTDASASLNLSIRNSTIQNNTAAMGGGIYGDGNIDVLNGNLTGNSATAGIGGCVCAQNGNVDIADSVISNNSGGGVYVQALSALTMNRVTLLGNTVSRAYAWDLSPAEQALHQSNIKDSTYTAPFLWAYNNADVNYQPSELMIVYHRNYDLSDTNEIGVGPVPAGSVFPLLKTAAELGWAREGYRFLGWATDAVGTVLFESPALMAGETIHLYGNWMLTPAPIVEPGDDTFPGIIMPPPPKDDDKKKDTGKDKGNGDKNGGTNGGTGTNGGNGTNGTANGGGTNSTTTVSNPSTGSGENGSTTGDESTGVDIEEGKVPTTGPDTLPGVGEEPPIKVGDGSGSWALFNLLLVVLNFGLMVFLLITWFLPAQDEDEQAQRRGVPRALSVLIAIAAIVIFILTENIGLPMQMSDGYTPAMVVAALLQVLLLLFAKRRETERYNQ